MQVIKSKDNETIKYIKKLKDKKYRIEYGKYVIEGIKLIKEAIQEDVPIHKIVICEECMKDGNIEQKLLYEIAKYDCIYVTESIFDTISDVKTHQGILAVVQKNDENNKIDYSQDLIVILDDIQDPGNIGTIIRTIDSAGLNQVILTSNTIDVYNPKVVRSTMGAIFRVNIIQSEDIIDTIHQIKKHKFKVISTDLNTENDIYNTELNKSAIIIGNEANGVSEKLKEVSDDKIKIPMFGKTESLNVSVATGIIIYEHIRRKNLK